jgi:hypothetical protein
MPASARAGEQSHGREGVVVRKIVPSEGENSSAPTRPGRGWAPLAAACVLLLGLSALRFLFEADEQHSWFLGHAFGSACWFRARMGIPCPNCGMTRSLILAAHGEFALSWRLAPGGVAMILASIVASLMLGAFGVVLLCGRLSTVRWFQTALRVTVLACAGLSASVWLGGWAVEVVRSFRLW